MTEPLSVTHEMISSWADDPQGPVALHLKQKLLPVEGEGGVIFPPTYADIGYNIDTLSDGTKVATIDSVGSQANRMEPIFKNGAYAELVPQITIQLGNQKSISLLDAGHRLGDALVRASDDGLEKEATAAFSALQRGDPSLIAKLAPTSLVFGVWDSRGEGTKVPRLVSSVVRAWDVEVLHRAATYLPAVDFASEDLLGPHNEDKAEKDARSSLGFQHAPATWTPNEKVPEYREGQPNSERRIPGGIIARGGIFRDVTINLVALRRLGEPADQLLRQYILGLALVAGSDPQDGFLRQGCLLTPDPDADAGWTKVGQAGQRNTIAFSSGDPLNFALAAAKKYGVVPPRTFDFKKDKARRLIDEQKGRRGSSSKKRGRSKDGGDEAALEQ